MTTFKSSQLVINNIYDLVEKLKLYKNKNNEVISKDRNITLRFRSAGTSTLTIRDNNTNNFVYVIIDSAGNISNPPAFINDPSCMQQNAKKALYTLWIEKNKYGKITSV